MKLLGLASFSAVLIAALTAQGGDDAAQKREKAALQGKWKIVSWEMEGIKDPEFVGAILEFAKDGKSVIFTHNEKSTKSSFKLNPAGKPKQIDINPGDEEKQVRGIYQVTKNMLKICQESKASVGRPTDFVVKEDKYILITLEKQK